MEAGRQLLTVYHNYRENYNNNHLKNNHKNIPFAPFFVIVLYCYWLFPAFLNWLTRNRRPDFIAVNSSEFSYLNRLMCE